MRLSGITWARVEGSRAVRRTYTRGRFGPLKALIGVALIAVVIGLTAEREATQVRATFPGANGKIAFVRYPHDVPDPIMDIFVMNPDGSDQVNLTNDPSDDGSPAWSPNGEKIAFSKQIGASIRLNVMNADGSGRTQIGHVTDASQEPTWSPDGAKIAFTFTAAGNPEIYLIDPVNGGETRLTTNPGPDRNPDWSPDGTKIAFESQTAAHPRPNIYVINPDGTGRTRLTDSTSTGYASEPSWSPDGSRIAYSGDDNEIFVMNSDGSNQHNISNSPSDGEGGPDWSPDGNHIVFARVSSAPFDHPDIYVMNADGTAQTQLTTGPDFVWNGAAVWQPLLSGPGLTTPTPAPTPGPTLAPGSVGGTLNLMNGNDETIGEGTGMGWEVVIFTSIGAGLSVTIWWVWRRRSSRRQ